MNRRRFLLETNIDLSATTIKVAAQTYDGNVKTPEPKITFKEWKIPSSGYTTSYSNNTNAGTATVVVTGKDNFKGTVNKTFTINKAIPIYTAPTATNYTYSGSSRSLLYAGSSSHGTFQYSSNNSSWSTSVPASTSAGQYPRYWKLVGDSNHVDVPSTILQCHINQASGYWSTYPSANTLYYTGSSQYLVTAGSGAGTVYYSYRYKSFTSSSWGSWSSYSSSRPSRTATGNYQVRSYCSGNTNYSSSSTYTVDVTINRATRTISFSSTPSSLNVGSTATLSASPSAGSGDGTITYSTSNSSVASISGSTLTGVGAGTCTITATISEGTNYSSATTSFTLTVS